MVLDNTSAVINLGNTSVEQLSIKTKNYKM